LTLFRAIRINKINKINSEEEIIVHTQFTGFGDDGNELRKPYSVKINTRPEDTQKWIESFREKMIEIYDLEERPVQHGYQFALYKNGSKYVSVTFSYLLLQFHLAGICNFVVLF
jgi:hypothetical protein